MDKLLHLIEHEVHSKNWKSMKLGRKGSRISHLMFVDDLLLFGEAAKIQMECVINILNKFCRKSRPEVS